MEFLYPFFISLIMVFIAELGDKTQLLVLSFSGRTKVKNIILGIALGSFFSHGIATLFGSKIGLLENEYVHNIIEIITYSSFIIMGILSLLPQKINSNTDKKSPILNKISNLKINYVFIIALSILVGEIGDKTFLASLGFGIQYPNHKIMLVSGSILGMIASNFIAILFGKFLSSFVSEEKMQKFSGILFLLFGILGFVL